MVPQLQWGMPASTVHIVAGLHDLSGAGTHAASLRAALRQLGHQVSLWSDRASDRLASYDARLIQPFSGALPRGGTLVLVGAYLQLWPWIAHAKPTRLILICINSDPVSLHGTLARLSHPSLPSAELVYVSQRLRDTIGIAGRICPEIVDLERFHPPTSNVARPFTLGRLSRDTPEKHHPDDMSLYRMLAWQAAQIRLMGANCLSSTLDGTPGIELLPAGAEDAADFLRSLDVFFYRTRSDWNEPSGRVVMEALASGLPIVAHVSGGYTDWIRHGENGFLFTTQEEALQHLQRLRTDHVLRATLAHNARSTAEALASAEGEQARDYLAWLAGGA